MTFDLTNLKVLPYHFHGGDQFSDHDLVNAAAQMILNQLYDVKLHEYQNNGDRINDIGPLYVIVVQMSSDPDENPPTAVINMDLSNDGPTYLKVDRTYFIKQKMTFEVHAMVHVTKSTGKRFTIKYKESRNAKLLGYTGGSKDNTNITKYYYICTQYKEEYNNWNQLLDNE